ncbi:MAG: Tat pathway signal sequence domain protein [Chloracidobacterium sp.]|nr:Tat pathway signal sequence domain protein [Chloracidobacterium sp.]
MRANGNLPDSFLRVYSFLDEMMDAYAQGATLRLIQSYSDQQGLLSTAFTYDNALVVQAYLLRGRNDDIDKARTLGNSLIYAQQNDPNFKDGRLRQAYFVDQPDPNGVFIRLALNPFFFTGSAVGDMAWAAIALAQLFWRTKERRYLDGALNLGDWIFNVTFDTRGAGGYNFGVDGGNNPQLFKSTEHNIDAYALFGMLARLTGSSVWDNRAEHARNFLAAMWNSDAGFFWTGTGADGATINRDNIPEDTQAWSFMALRDDLFATSIDWAKTNLATTDTPQTINSRLTGNIRINGSSFASLSLRSLAPSSQFDQAPDPNGVWLEGTAHLASALLDRKLGRGRDIDGFDGDEKTARILLDNIELAQESLGRDQTIGGKALAGGQGVVAASSVVNTGFGSSFYPNLHLAASSWYVIAGQSGNPFQLGFR